MVSDRAADALQYLNAGCARDEWVRAGMAAKSAGLDFDDFNNWSATAGNYKNENDCRTVWKSFSESGGVTPATLFGMARAQGWSDETRANGNRPARPMPKPAPVPQTPVKQAASANAFEVWERCISATIAEPYIDRKKGKPDGLRVYSASTKTNHGSAPGRLLYSPRLPNTFHEVDAVGYLSHGEKSITKQCA